MVPDKQTSGIFQAHRRVATTPLVSRDTKNSLVRRGLMHYGSNCKINTGTDLKNNSFVSRKQEMNWFVLCSVN